MAFIIKDRVKEGTSSVGIGAIELSGPSSTFIPFNSFMVDGDTTYYAIVHTTSGVDEWEVGLGTWNTGNTITRTTILSGSNGTSAVDFSDGIKDVFMTYPASVASYTDGSVVSNIDIQELASVTGLAHITPTSVAATFELDLSDPVAINFPYDPDGYDRNRVIYLVSYDTARTSYVTTQNRTVHIVSRDMDNVVYINPEDYTVRLIKQSGSNTVYIAA